MEGDNNQLATMASGRLTASSLYHVFTLIKMTFTLAHRDDCGYADFEEFDSLGEVQSEINRLETCLEDGDSWRIRDTIAQLQEIIAENEEDQ